MRLVALLLGAAAAIGVLPAVPASAQTEAVTGSRLGQPKPAEVPSRKGRSQTDIAREVTYDFGQCVVLRYPGRVAEIAGDTLSPAQVSAVMRRIADSACLRDAELRMPEPLMRGAIFRGLYLRDFAKEQPVLPGQAINYTPIAGPPGTPESSGFIAFMDFADCAVRSEPSVGRDFVIARPGSPQEDAALAAIAPKLGPCMQEGATVRFGRASLAAILSEALYRQSRAAIATNTAAPAVAGP